MPCRLTLTRRLLLSDTPCTVCAASCIVFAAPDSLELTNDRHAGEAPYVIHFNSPNWLPSLFLFFFFFDNVLVLKAPGPSLFRTRDVPALDSLHTSITDGPTLTMVHRAASDNLYSDQ